MKILSDLRREVVDGHDTTNTRPLGEVGEFGEAGSLVLKADEAEARGALVGLLLGQRLDTGVADDHAEALLLLVFGVPLHCVP